MTAVASKSFVDLSPAEREALLLLLEDDDPAVEDLLVEQLVSYGLPAVEWLEPLRAKRPAVFRHRVGIVRRLLGRQRGDVDFLAYCAGSREGFDLEEGIWRLVRTEYPEASVEGYRALLDSFAEVLGERLAGGELGKAGLSEISSYLFGELEFAGNEEDFYDPENSFLNRVIDRRVGIPVSLSVLYLLIARRLCLPVAGIGMPGRFLCRYQTPRVEYYIDVFGGGRLFDRSECVRFLRKSLYGYREEFLAPVSARAIVLRVCRNLRRIYSRSAAEGERALRYQRYVAALSRMG